jgi:hypothetical protein
MFSLKVRVGGWMTMVNILTNVRKGRKRYHLRYDKGRVIAWLSLEEPHRY